MNQRIRVKVRQVRAEEWRELREVRLRALRDSPGSFTTTAAQAEAEPDRYWADRAALAAEGEVWATFLALNGNEAVGMVSGGSDQERQGVVGLIQMWVDPSWRNRSIGTELVGAVVSWASDRFERIRLGVASDNGPAIRLFERCEFVPTGEEDPFPERPGIRIRYFERILR